MTKANDFIVNRRTFIAMMAASAASPLLSGLSSAQAQEQKDVTVRIAVSDFSSELSIRPWMGGFRS